MKRRFLGLLATCSIVSCAFALTDWERNMLNVDNKVKAYQNAVKGGDESAIRKTMMDIQADPIAVQWFNKNGTTAEKQRFQDDTKKIRDAAKDEITKQTVEKWNDAVDKWNKANPDKTPRQHIEDSDVSFFEATNANPNAKPKAPQDWDVTVRVNGQDVPPKKIQEIVDNAYYNAAGGKETFGNKTASDVARQNSVNAIDSKHLEAYKDPETLLKTKEKYVQGQSTPERYAYGEQFSDTMQYKSSIAVKEGNDKLTVEGKLQGEFEQFRQATKQYDNIVKPHVESLGGKVDPNLQKSMDIMKKVSNFEMSPDEAKAALAKLGETPESVIQKASQQIEAAEKLRPNELNKADAEAAKAKEDANKSTKADNKKGDADSKTKGNDGKSGAKTDADAKTKAEDPYAKDHWPPDADTDTKTAKPDAKTESKTGSKSDPKSSTKADTKADSKPGPKTEPEAGSKPESRVDSKAEPKTDTKSNSKTETKTETKSTDTKTFEKAETDSTKTVSDSSKTTTSDNSRPATDQTKTTTDQPKSPKTEADAPGKTKVDTDSPKVKTSDIDSPKVKPVDVDAPKVKPVDVDGPKVKPVDVDAPKVKPVDVDGPKVKPVDVDAPKVKPVDVDGPKVKPVDVDGGKVKTGDVPNKIGKAVEVGGTILNIGQYGEGAKQFTDGINEGDWDKAKEGYKDTIMNVADDATMGAASAGKNVVGAINEGKGYFNEKDELNKQVQGGNYEQTLVHDLVTKGGYSVEDARKIAEGYTSGDERGVARLEAAYNKMGENIPDKESVGMTWKETGEALGDYAKDVAGAGKDVVVGVGKTAVNVGKGVVSAGEIAVGMTEKGVAEEVGKTMGENLSNDNLSAGAEVVGQMTKEIAEEAKDSLRELVGIDKNADTKEHIVKSLTSQGATKEEAERVANEYIRDKENRNGGSSTVLKDFKNELNERSEEEKLEAQKKNIRDAIKDLQDKALAGDEDAAKQMDELRQQYRDLREKENELKEAKETPGESDSAGVGFGSLKSAEGCKLPAPGDDKSIADLPVGGSLGSFLDEKSNDLSNKASADLWLSQNVTQEREQEEINKEFSDIAKGIVSDAANDANLINQRIQSDAANRQYQDSWGKAVADGVQSGVEQGMGEFAGTFGSAAGDEAAGKMLGHKKPRDHHAHDAHGGHDPIDDAHGPSEAVPAGSNSGGSSQGATPDAGGSANGGGDKTTSEPKQKAQESKNTPSGDKKTAEPKASETKSASTGTDESKDDGGKVKFTQPGTYTVSSSSSTSSKSSSGSGGLKCCKCGGNALSWLVSGSKYYCYNCWGQRKSSDGKTLQQGLEEISGKKNK